ncbi:HAD family hydrolase [Marinomonas rhizomae]|uniref:Phosphoglycolate phosphatase n=1 Tax=Marinomonas rhizomae TaxID=491948 RepID=A0A366JCQ8_9GAMM|nr:HAD-IA family hydrolase [Marinomonas rhizomae]RBP84761.1 phosphoglycolate phosphatase [Marinomonas rhizomae]RNF75042.1 HAD family hydrolase [Marinomonas rhizomae]
MVKLVIFDWDGTLFDSIDTICHSMLQAGHLASAPARTKDDIKNIIGLSLDKAVDTVWPELPLNKQNIIIEHYKAIYVAADQTPSLAYAGVIDGLKKLQSTNIQMAVATGKSRRGLDRAMTLTNTRDYFTVSRCADEALSKPHPLMLEQILAELNILPEHAIMVGDTEYDLNMATNAGIKSIGVTYGAHQEERLKACQPHALINDFNQLSNILGL